MLDLLVLGGGPAGLAHAFWRKRANPALDLKLVERAPQPGGWVQTRRIEGFSCEVGPQGFRMNDKAAALIDALGIAGAVVPARPEAKLRFIGRGGKLIALPAGPKDLLKTPLLTLRGKMRLLREPFVRRNGAPGESLRAFVERRLGAELVPLADAFVSGIYAGDAAQLEVESAFPTLVRFERECGSLLAGARAARKQRATHAAQPMHKAAHDAALYTFRTGMEDLVQALRRALEGHLLLGRPVIELAHEGNAWRATLGGEVPTTLEAKAVALAVPAPAAALLLQRVDAELAQALREIPYASVANVYLGFSDTSVQQRLQGFGFLLELAEQSALLGAIYVSSLFPDRAMPGKLLVRVMLGGVRHPATIDDDDETLARLAEDMLRRYTGIDAPLTFRRVIKARNAIPQYTLGHAARLARIGACLRRHPGLTLLGNSYREVSLVGQLGPDPALP